jgi:hypothetical protein
MPVSGQQEEWMEMVFKICPLMEHEVFDNGEWEFSV